MLFIDSDEELAIEYLLNKHTLNIFNNHLQNYGIGSFLGHMRA